MNRAYPPLLPVEKLNLQQVIRSVPHWAEPDARYTRATGCRKRGLDYERKVEEKLEDYAAASGVGSVVAGAWFEYTAAGKGSRFCQPDFVLVGEERCLVVESKLTQCSTTHQRWLYPAVCEWFFGKPTGFLLVCKNLVAGGGAELVKDFHEAWSAGRGVYHFPALH